jgi:transcriptional regulator with XRE-family HTH domain
MDSTSSNFVLKYVISEYALLAYTGDLKMEWHEFGARVKSRREQLNISQQEIANALKIDQAKVSLIEKGARKVDVIKELPKLAEVLRCSMSALVLDEQTRSADDNDPVKQLMKQYFPGTDFSDFEMKRISQFLEPVIQSYVKSSPELEKKVANR